MKTETLTENKMGVMPIPKLLITISLPMILSMLVQALYNVVDSIFVAKVSEEALTAVSLAFPIQNLMIAVTVGTSIGVNALVSRFLGQKAYDKSNIVARNGLFLTGLSYLLFAIIGLTCSHLFFSTQTTNDTIVHYGVDYMSIVCILSFGLFYQVLFERLLQSTGKTVLTMITQGIGAIVNLILDPILIFGLFGLPRMEVAGAALATVIGQITAACVGLILCKKYNKEINISLKKFRPCLSVISDIYKIGFPAIIMQAIGSIMVFGFNSILLLYSTTAAAVFGIYFKLQSFVFMPIFGLTNGLISIIAYNYGAQNKKRIKESYRLACLIAVGIMIIGIFIFQTCTATLLHMFEASDHMLEIGIPALRIISLCFPVAGYAIVSSATFQALGHSVYSLFLSVARQLLALLPIAFLLANTFGLAAIWWAFPLAEIISGICAVTFIRRIYRDVVNPLP